MDTRKIIVRLSLVAGLLVLAMFFVTLATGVAQEPFEFTQPANLYAHKLVEAQNPLRLIFSIDLVFITVFTTLFVIIPQSLRTGERAVDTLAAVATGAMLLCGSLDFYEDLHILTMLDSAVKNLPVQQTEIAAQMLLSMIKFFASYFALFLLAFLLPGRTFWEKFLKSSLWYFQLPIGILVYTAPESLQIVFNLLRFAFMASGFFLLAYNFSRKTDEL